MDVMNVHLKISLFTLGNALTGLCLKQEAVHGAGGAGHVGQRDLPKKSDTNAR